MRLALAIDTPLFAFTFTAGPKRAEVEYEPVAEPDPDVAEHGYTVGEWQREETERLSRVAAVMDEHPSTWEPDLLDHEDAYAQYDLVCLSCKRVVSTDVPADLADENVETAQEAHGELYPGHHSYLAIQVA